MKNAGADSDPVISAEIYSREKLCVTEREQLKQSLAWMLCLNEDLREFYGLAEHDSLVKLLINDLYGMKNTKTPDVFSRLILAVTLQMAPIARSDQMMTLLIKQYGESLRFDGKTVLYWPSPAKIASAGVDELKEKCKLGYRAKSLRAIAQSIVAGFPSLEELEQMSPEEAKHELMELPGIGEYSADIVSPHRGFPLDVWSAKIFNQLLLNKKTKSPREEIPKLRKIAEQRWGKSMGYVFIYVLQDLKNLAHTFKLDIT